ncbi:hypothetical protein [Jidongwangia harbinensis]|uniref:hypothetical protein n=1 Tax=Jidongwangia harbinensis TaxID=2878561 RepID=UPI001CDA4309|nr:hypothetical protein [Jidongwangia harbinensis]MCA2215808.1 hypothetical protein [Jidongwangia harbinensis]
MLALKGHRILHISPKKATLEQGKDITSIDSDGVVHCYQLKGDDVTLDRWRREIKPELDVLVDVPPKHPSLSGDAKWVCHLVVNGEFKGEALREIYDTRQAWVDRGKKSFDTVTRGELLREFCDAYGTYLPRELNDFSGFLDLYREGGAEPLNKELLSQLIEGFFGQILPDRTKIPSNNEVRQTLNAAAISVAYLLTNKYKEKNHVAIIEGWLMLAAYVMAVAEKTGIDQKYWKPCQDVIAQAIEGTFDDLVAEIGDRSHYAESAAVPYADAYVYKARVTILAGYLAAFVISKVALGSSIPSKSTIEHFLTEALDKKLIQMTTEGECAQLAIAAVALSAMGDNVRARRLNGSCLQALLDFSDEKGFLDPYVEPQEVIRTFLGLSLHPVYPVMGKNSYAMEALVLIHTYLRDRDALTNWWRKISHISFQTFKPRDPWQWFYWRSPHGKVEGRFPAQTQSWASLVQSTSQPDDGTPQLLREQWEYLPLLLCLMPHRFSGSSIRNVLSNLPATSGGTSVPEPGK